MRVDIPSSVQMKQFGFFALEMIALIVFTSILFHFKRLSEEDKKKFRISFKKFIEGVRLINFFIFLWLILELLTYQYNYSILKIIVAVGVLILGWVILRYANSPQRNKLVALMQTYPIADWYLLFTSIAFIFLSYYSSWLMYIFTTIFYTGLLIMYFIKYNNSDIWLRLKVPLVYYYYYYLALVVAPFFMMEIYSLYVDFLWGRALW